LAILFRIIAAALANSMLLLPHNAERSKPIPKKSDILLYAHRGIGYKGPQNSICNFRGTLNWFSERNMQPRIETDVRPAIGGFVIFHDPSVGDLMADTKDKLVSELSVAKLQRLKFKRKGFEDCNIATLDEYAAFAAKYGVETILDLKADKSVWTPESVRTVVTVMGGASGKVIYASGNVAVLHWVRAAAPSAHVLRYAGRGALTTRELAELKPFNGNVSISKRPDGWDADKKGIARARADGLSIGVATIPGLWKPSQTAGWAKRGVSRFIVDIVQKPEPQSGGHQGGQGNDRPGTGGGGQGRF